MAQKDIIMQRKKADGTFDQYYPKTRVENVEGAAKQSNVLFASLCGTITSPGYTRTATYSGDNLVSEALSGGITGTITYTYSGTDLTKMVINITSPPDLAGSQTITYQYNSDGSYKSQTVS